MSNFYAPVLKWKKGEQVALQNVMQKDKIRPIIELTEPTTESEFLKALKKCYELPIYLDTQIAYDEDFDFLSNVIDKANEENITIYPIVNVYNLNDFNISDNIDTLGIKIKIFEELDDDDDDDEDDEDEIEGIFDYIKLFKTQNNNLNLDIILDLGVVTTKKAAKLEYEYLKDILNDYFLDEDFYNNIIISVTSFPEDLSNLEAGGEIEFKRYDYKIFKDLYKEFEDLQDYLKYSDYGVTKFTDSDIDFSIMKYGVLPKVKYTLKKKYLVWKGKRNKNTKKLDISYYTLAEKLIKKDFYYGEDFSFGDKDIKDRYEKANARGDEKCGNGGTWVTISANHHIAVVIEQLSKLCDL